MKKKKAHRYFIYLLVFHLPRVCVCVGQGMWGLACVGMAFVGAGIGRVISFQRE